MYKSFLFNLEMTYFEYIRCIISPYSHFFPCNLIPIFLSRLIVEIGTFYSELLTKFAIFNFDEFCVFRQDSLTKFMFSFRVILIKFKFLQRSFDEINFLLQQTNKFFFSFCHLSKFTMVYHNRSAKI